MTTGEDDRDLALALFDLEPEGVALEDVDETCDGTWDDTRRVMGVELELDGVRSWTV